MFKFGFFYFAFVATAALANFGDVRATLRAQCIPGLELAHQSQLYTGSYGQLGSFDDVRWKGLWKPAPSGRQQFLRTLYMQTGGKTFGNNYDIVRRAVGADIKANAWSGDQPGAVEHRKALHRRVLENWTQPTRPEAKLLAEKIKPFGYDGFSPLFYFTSGAGNWRRGAQLVKALVPLNLKESLEESDWHTVKALADFMIAEPGARGGIVAKARAEGARHAPMLSVQNPELTEKLLRGLITKARHNGTSINPMEAKLAQVAVLSSLTRRYIHFDIWTSRATHKDIRDALLDFRREYLEKQFFEEPNLNRFVHDAISRYLAADVALGETHLFGYQEEVMPMSIDPRSPRFLQGEVANGEGAGMAYQVLKTTGRLAQLELRGVEHWMFQNIEVLSMDLLAQFGAYLELGLPVGVVVVPERDGFKGGYPFVVRTTSGEELIVLIEGTGLPPELLGVVPDSYFNTNTFYNSIRLHPALGMDFERRVGRTRPLIAVPKLSLAFQTHTNRTGLIRGDLGWDYLNFKDLADYGNSGAHVLDLFRGALRELFTTSSSGFASAL